MVAVSLYRGKLHHVPKVPRRWPMPSRAVSLRQFKILAKHRFKALSRCLPQPPPPSTEKPLHPHVEQQETAAADVKVKAEQEDDRVGDGADAGACGVDVKVEATLSKNEEKKKELEKTLDSLNAKKHHLVQILKQITNFEEELKIRKEMQAKAARPPIPQQVDMSNIGPSARNVATKLKVEVTFSDPGVDSGYPSSHSTQTHHFQTTPCTPPSTASPHSRQSQGSFQYNSVLPYSRGSLLSTRNVQTSPIMLNRSATTSPSPSFARQGHPASLPPQVSLSGSHYPASSPSPAASGGTSSAF